MKHHHPMWFTPAACHAAAGGRREGCGPRGQGWFKTHGHSHGHGPWGPGRCSSTFPADPAGGRAHGAATCRAAVLALLKEQPMHGYQILQELEARSQGMWRPSAGSVYPALQLLEDQGLVKADEVEGKRVFALTAEGVAAAEEAGGGAPPWQPASDETSDRRIKLRDAFFQLGAAVRQIGVTGDDLAVDRPSRLSPRPGAPSTQCLPTRNSRA